MKDRIIQIVEARLRIEDERLYSGIIERIAEDISYELGDGMTMDRFYELLIKDLPGRFRPGHVSCLKNDSGKYYFASVYDFDKKNLIQTGATPSALACIEMIKLKIQQVVSEDTIKSMDGKEIVV